MDSSLSCLEELTSVISSINSSTRLLLLMNGVSDFFSFVKRLAFIGSEESNMKSLFLPLSELTNDRNFVDCMASLPQNDAWFRAVEPLIIDDPVDKDLIIENYESIGISEEFIKRVLLYTSGRPVVNLLKFLKLYNLRPRKYNLIPERIANNMKEPYYLCNMGDGVYNDIHIPIVRYQHGMGGYVTGRAGNNGFCGTFYYFEPESPFFLESSTTLVSWNKITGSLALGIPLDTVSNMLYESIEDDTSLPSDMGFEVDPTKSMQEQWLEIVHLYQEKEINPLRHYPDLYAKEDVFDQILCLEAKRQGIDCIILKYMTGASRVVSEVLDTRSRIQSFSSILSPM